MGEVGCPEREREKRTITFQIRKMSGGACGGCKVLKFYAEKDVFTQNIACLLCDAVISVPDDDNYVANNTSELPQLEELQQAVTDHRAPFIDQSVNAQIDGVNGEVLTCDNNWCSFNIHIKNDDDKERRGRARLLLDAHHRKCNDYYKKGRRFKRTKNKNGGEQGYYVSIAKHGTDLKSIKSEPV